MRRHRFDPFSFLFGAVFVTIGATILFGASGSGNVRAVHVWPAVIVVVGAALALWAIGRVLRPEPALGGGSDRRLGDDPTERLEPVADSEHDGDVAPDAAASGATPHPEDLD
jgi:hypothetical protein